MITRAALAKTQEVATPSASTCASSGADGGLILAAKAFKERANQHISRTGI